MEYRGYDSVGVATLDDGHIILKKGIGKVSEVSNFLHLKELPGLVGIGHTRWATHGGVTDKNAHPHFDCKNKIAVVHNGIIDNYRELKAELIEKGHIFSSQTDSEVISHLLEDEYLRAADIKQSTINTCHKLTGSYAFVAIFEDGTLCGARYDEPLIIGILNNGYFCIK
jgi:glucosamine--fructose-6-phosphate aminotransferase (isomerizing)